MARHVSGQGTTLLAPQPSPPPCPLHPAAPRPPWPTPGLQALQTLQPCDALWRGIAAANPTLAPLLESSGPLHTSILPTAAGRAEAPRWVPSRPPAFDGIGSWSAPAVYVDLEARVDPALAGMPLHEVARLVRTQHRDTLGAVEAATLAIAACPGCTAAQLRGLLRCHGSVLERTAPGGASALLMTGSCLPGLLGERRCWGGSSLGAGLQGGPGRGAGTSHRPNRHVLAPRAAP